MRRRAYTEVASCRKCGWKWAASKYKAESDKVERKCDRCGYTWMEPPVSAEPA